MITVDREQLPFLRQDCLKLSRRHTEELKDKLALDEDDEI